MQNKLMITAIVMMMMTSCSKTNVKEIIEGTIKDTRPDYTLNFQQAATGKIVYLQSHNREAGAKAGAAYSVKRSALQLRVGDTELLPLAGLKDILYTTIDFPARTKPEDIAGTYQFPGANNQLSVKVYNIVGKDTLVHTMPYLGSLEVQYDAATKKLSGKFNDLLFRYTAGGQLYTDRFSGKFNHVAAEN